MTNETTTLTTLTYQTQAAGRFVRMAYGGRTVWLRGTPGGRVLVRLEQDGRGQEEARVWVEDATQAHGAALVLLGRLGCPSTPRAMVEAGRALLLAAGR